MNHKFYIICTVTLLTIGASASIALGIPFSAELTAKVYGETYEGGTFEHLNDTVIEINSTPPQSIVAKNGKYSFDLMPGDYTITARYYQNNTLIYSRETTFKIEDEGNYVFDLLLYPVSETPAIGENAAKMDNSNKMQNSKSLNLAGKIKKNFSSLGYLLLFFMLLFLLGRSYKLSRKHDKKTKVNEVQEEKPEEKTTHVPRYFVDSVNVLLIKVLSKSTGLNVKNGLTSNNGKTVSLKEPVVEPADNPQIRTPALKKFPLPDDLQGVISIIRSHKGQITQKELRSRLNYSEVKVSTMLSELEKRGLIKKLKNGRENIVILVDEDTKTQMT